MLPTKWYNYVQYKRSITWPQFHPAAPVLSMLVYLNVIFIPGLICLYCRIAQEKITCLIKPNDANIKLAKWHQATVMELCILITMISHSITQIEFLERSSIYWINAEISNSFCSIDIHGGNSSNNWFCASDIPPLSYAILCDTSGYITSQTVPWFSKYFVLFTV